MVPQVIRHARMQLKTTTEGMFGIQGTELIKWIPGFVGDMGHTNDSNLVEKPKRKVNTFLATIMDTLWLPVYPKEVFF